MGLFSRDNDDTTAENTGFITIDPDLGKKPILPAGDYEGVLDRCDVRASKFTDGQAAHFEVVVRTPELGIVRLFADKDLVQGTPAIRWFRQLGVTNEEMRAGVDFSKLAGLAVNVSVGIRQYTPRDSDETVQANTIKNIVKL